MSYPSQIDPETGGLGSVFEMMMNSKLRFLLKKGTLLMMDNYRLLHGRTAFDSNKGQRHLQGCYRDHDGVTSLYRMLANGNQLTSVPSEEVEV